MADIVARPINPFPPHRRGLWRVRSVPYLYKDRWPEAPFGDRWRRLKAKVSPAPDRRDRGAVEVS